MLYLETVLAEREPTEDELTAYHEAAHFVMGMIAMGGLPRRVSIEPVPGEYMGVCGGSPGGDLESIKRLAAQGFPVPYWAVRCDVLFALAGTIFEENYGYAPNTGDDTVIEADLRFLHGEDWEDHYHAYYNFALKLMNYAAFQRAWNVVAERLLTHKTLDDDQIWDAHEAARKALGKWGDKLNDKVRLFAL